MKSLPTLALILFLTVSINASAANDIPQGLYYKESANGVVKINPHSFTGRKTSSEINFLFEDVNNFALSIYQPNAELEITDRQPEFLLILNPSGKTSNTEYKSDWVFSSANSPADFLLCPLSENKKSRLLKVGKSVSDSYSFYTAVGPEMLKNVEMQITLTADNTYLLKPTKKLKNGHYALIYIGGFVNENIPPYIVFDFDIVNYTAETLDKIKPGMLYSEVVEIMHYQPKKKKKEGERMVWNFPGAGKVYFHHGAVVEIVPEQ